MKSNPMNALRAIRNGALALVFAGLLVAILAPIVQAEARNSAEVSFLQGTASSLPGGNGAPAALAVKSQVFENDAVTTGPNTKLELKLKDGSVIRLGAASKLVIKSAYFGKSGEKNFSAKLMFGQVWSKVSGLLGGDSKFEVETDNAVAGVRGTTFRVDAKADKSVLVRVYAGTVAMASGTAPTAGEHKPSKRRQVAGPKAISRDQWEKIVGRMMQLAVNADGTAGDPVAFTEADDKGDEWAAWNNSMDAK